MEDNILSYKSFVLGSLNSGQQVTGRVFSSSCHNYFINVTSVGYNLVVDLDSSSTKLFLLVKASPILRHSLEDEHNYASYYQFKKQGDHHGVVVTSEHLSPGRWYIGVCNYVQDNPFAEEGSNPLHESERQIDAEYRVTASLKKTATSDECKDASCKATSIQVAKEAALEECGEGDLCRWKTSTSSKSSHGLESGVKRNSYTDTSTAEAFAYVRDAPGDAGKQEEKKRHLKDFDVPSASKDQSQDYQSLESPPQEICGSEITSICKVCSKSANEKSTAAQPKSFPCSKGFSSQLSFVIGFSASLLVLMACVVWSPYIPNNLNPALKVCTLLYRLSHDDGKAQDCDERVSYPEAQEDSTTSQIQVLEAKNSALELKLQQEKLAVESANKLLEEMRKRDDQVRMERDQSAKEFSTQALDLLYTKQELEEMRSKVQQLEQLSIQWQAQMEAAEKKIYRISREKAAAEKAAEVLEEEVNAVRGRLKDIEKANLRMTNSPQMSRARGYEARAREHLDLKQLAVPDDERLYSAFDLSPPQSSAKSPSLSGPYVGSETAGGSTAETSPAEGRFFSGRYFCGTQPVGDQRSPFSRSTSAESRMHHYVEAPLGLPLNLGCDTNNNQRQTSLSPPAPAPAPPPPLPPSYQTARAIAFKSFSRRISPTTIDFPVTFLPPRSSCRSPLLALSRSVAVLALS
eukprot:671189-Hanusia_phi.AAC.1